MELALARNWWVLVLRGVLSILFGVMVLLWPLLAMLAVVYVYAAYALVDGCFALGLAFTGQAGRRWWALLLEGVVGIAFGILTFLWPWAPVIDMVVMVYFIGGWLIATGVLEVVTSFQLPREIDGRWALALGGILSVLLGIGFVLFPGAGLLTTALFLGSYSLVSGILLLVLGFQLRRMIPKVPRQEMATVP